MQMLLRLAAWQHRCVICITEKAPNKILKTANVYTYVDGM